MKNDEWWVHTRETTETTHTIVITPEMRRAAQIVVIAFGILFLSMIAYAIWYEVTH